MQFLDTSAKNNGVRIKFIEIQHIEQNRYGIANGQTENIRMFMARQTATRVNNIINFENVEFVENDKPILKVT